MNNKNLTVCKANEVIEAGYKLSLNEQRVVLACISQVNSTEELLETDEFELSAKDFAVLYGISENRAYGELQEVAKNLYQRSLTILNPDPSRPKLKKIETRWISSIGYMPEEGKITLTFAQKLLPYLSELKGRFTRYKLENVGKMTSIHAIRLYELLMQWQSTGKREVELNWLKKQFQLDENYARMDNFKKRVLEPAVKDINTHSNLQVEWTQRKTGRRVTHLIFTFSEKEKEKPVTKTQTNKPLATKSASTQHLSKWELEQQRLAELSEIENKKHVDREKQREWDRKRKELSDKLSNEFGKQMRDAFLASMDEPQQQQLLADILAETTAQGDDFATGSIRKKGLHCTYARSFINQRIPNFAQERAAFIAKELAAHGF